MRDTLSELEEAREKMKKNLAEISTDPEAEKTFQKIISTQPNRSLCFQPNSPPEIRVVYPDPELTQMC